MSDKEIQSLDDLRAIIAEEQEQYISNLNRNKIRELIDNTFNEALSRAVLVTLGFEKDTFRGLRVDHCNGRQSDLRSYIKQTAKEEFTKWLNTAFNKIKHKYPTKEMIEAIEEDYKDEFNRQLYTEVKEKAQRDASEVIDNMSFNLSGKELQDLRDRIQGMKFLEEKYEEDVNI